MIVMPVVRWWLLLEVLGLVGLPISMRLLWHLPERGVLFRRTLGTVLPAVVFWILISTGFLQNTTAAAAFSVCLVGAVSLRIALRHGSELLETLRRLRRTVLLEEVLFVASLVLFALFRAYNPEIVATEKPMEFAFLNGILQSRTFPPQDPWLAGYSISYYYFGYLVAALLTRLSALASDVTFNLTGITLFALTVSGSFALVYDLALAGGQGQRAPSRSPARAGLLGAVLVAVMGNLEGVLELVRARGLGSEALWRWFDVRNLGSTPPSATWYPDDMWWWWRASRVIHDRDLLGNAQEVISEFPFFSFLLGDNHPHVLALPLVLLVLALALNTLLSRHEDAPEAAGARQGNGDGWLALAWHAWPHGPGQLVITGLLLGALAFTNTWDFPIYFAVFIAALALARFPGRSNIGSWLREVLLSSVALVAVTVVGYLPFFLSLRSQAGGIGLVPLHTKTAIQQFLLMFGVQIVLVVGFLTAVAMRLRAAWSEHQAPTLALIWAGACGLLALAALAVGWWTSSLCLVTIGASGGLLVAGAQLWADDRAGAPAAATLFALLLVTVAMLLLLSVEFVFLRDVFGTRMNTVFKFYYQGWVLLSLSSAYGVWYVLSRQAAGFATALRSAWLVLGAVLVLGGLSYTVAATASKANGFQGTPTLDGTAYVARERPQQYAVIQWLRGQAAPDSVIVEATGGSYTAQNWISAHTGLRSLIGWPGHELQWRGSGTLPAEREAAVEAIYTSMDSEETRRLLQTYQVDYVIIGPDERSRYGIGPVVLDKFDSLMSRAYQNEAYVVYARVW